MRMQRLVLFSSGFLALGSNSCSSPVPPSAQGAAIYQFRKAAQCNVNSFAEDKLGQANGSIRTPIVDGQNGASVSCRVVSNGGNFDINGSVNMNNGSSITIAAKGVSSGSNSSPATVSIYDRDRTGSTYTAAADMPCTLTVQSTSTDPKLAIAPGHAWAKFECPLVIDAQSPNSSGCAISDGYVVLENCDQQ